MREVEALVVGAGPTGLVAALELARHGVDVAVVDRRQEPHAQTRATGIVSASLEAFDRAGVLPALLAEAYRGEGGMAYDPEGNELGGYSLRELGSPFTFFAAVPQHRTEAVLSAALRGFGVEVERGLTMTDLTERDDGVDVTLVAQGGDGATWRARWVVGATGGDHTLRHALHERLEGGDYHTRYLTADVTFAGPIDDRRSASVVGGGLVTGLLKIPDGRRLVVLDAEPGHEPELDLATVRQLLAERLRFPVEVGALGWSSVFTLHHRIVPRMASDRIFLAGDAAHLCSLYGGFGLNGGVQDAVNLAWKIALVARGRARQALLDTYDRERQPENRYRVDLADAMHRSLRELAGDPLPPPDRPLPEVTVEGRSMIDVRYRPNAAVADVAGAGGRYGQPGLVRRSAGYGLHVGVGTEVPARLIDRWSGVVEPADGTGVPAGAAVLVRSDGIIAWSAERPAWEELDRFLRKAHLAN